MSSSGPGVTINGNLQVQNNTMPVGCNGPAATIENNKITGTVNAGRSLQRIAI